MFIFNAVRAVRGATLSALFAGCVGGLIPVGAMADGVGTLGPYKVTVKAETKYASPLQDTVIACLPAATSGHFAGPFPAVVLIHGGAWQGGNNAVGPGYTGSAATWCSLWASWGYAAFAIDYRLTGVKAWPAQIVDVQAAIRWVRAHAATFQVNKSMIVVNGDSAGGQLAMIAGYSEKVIAGDIAGSNALESSRPELVISQFGPWTFGPSRPAGTPSVRAEDYAKQILMDNADGRTTATTPNTMFVQGTKDTTVNQCTQSEPAFRFLTSNHHPASYVSYVGGHEFTGMNTSTWVKVVGDIELKTISFAYHRAHAAKILPDSEVGPNLVYTDQALPTGCP